MSAAIDTGTGARTLPGLDEIVEPLMLEALAPVGDTSPQLTFDELVEMVRPEVSRDLADHVSEVVASAIWDWEQSGLVVAGERKSDGCRAFRMTATGSKHRRLA